MDRDLDDYAEIDLNTVLMFLKTPLTKSIKVDDEKLGPGSYIKTFYLTNTAVNFKIIFTQMLDRERLTRKKVEIYSETVPSIQKEFRPKSKIRKPELVFSSRDDKVVKRIMDTIIDRFFDE